MNLQDIRKYYEYPVIDCCNLQGVEFRAENTLEPGGDAIHKFCLARLQFGEMAEQTSTVARSATNAQSSLLSITAQKASAQRMPRTSWNASSAVSTNSKAS